MPGEVRTEERSMTATRTTIGETGSADRAESDGRRPFPWWLWLVPFLLAVGIPALYRQRFYTIHPLRLESYLVGTLLVLVVGLIIVAAISSGFTRNRHEALAAGTASVLVLFHWPFLTGIGWRLFGSSLPILADVFPVVFGVGLVLLTARFADQAVVVIVFAVFGLAASWVLWSDASDRIVADPEPVVAVAAQPGAPDALLLVLDGYPRGDVLLSQFGFDNTGFYDALGERGFVVAEKATTAYADTHASIAAMYELDYVLEPGIPMSDEDYRRLRQVRSGDAVMVRAFAEAGYETTYFENSWPGSQCGVIWDVCVRDGLWYHTAYSMGQITPLAALMSNMVAAPFTVIGLDHLRRLVPILGRESETPRFIVAHVTVPHAPVHADADCVIHASEERSGLSLAWLGIDEKELDKRRQAFVEQVRCVNGLVLDALDAFLAAHPDGIVMVTSDHGTDALGQAHVDAWEWTDTQVLDRMAALGAYRFGDCPAAVAPDTNTINGARRFVGCALGTPMEDLPNQLYSPPNIGRPSEPVVDLSEHLPALTGADDLS